MKCWWHHADPSPDGVAGAFDLDGLVVHEDLALVRLQQSIQDVHQRGLAGAVLAEQRVDLAGFDGEVDVIVRDEATETFRDAAQFESQRRLLIRNDK
jgi:hypothetical protein